MNRRGKVLLDQARMIAQRLERLSADSIWAHAASGHRGSLLKAIDRLEHLPDPNSASAEEMDLVEMLNDRGFDLLAKAAREIGDPELLEFATRRGA